MTFFEWMDRHWIVSGLAVLMIAEGVARAIARGAR